MAIPIGSGLHLAWEALEAPPGTTAVLNAANEGPWRHSWTGASALTRSMR